MWPYVTARFCGTLPLTNGHQLPHSESLFIKLCIPSSHAFICLLPLCFIFIFSCMFLPNSHLLPLGNWWQSVLGELVLIQQQIQEHEETARRVADQLNSGSSQHKPKVIHSTVLWNNPNSATGPLACPKVLCIFELLIHYIAHQSKHYLKVHWEIAIWDWLLLEVETFCLQQ